MEQACNAVNESEWHYVPGFDVHGWDGFQVRICCNLGQLHVAKVMKCPNGSAIRRHLYATPNNNDSGKVTVSLHCMRAGMFGCIPKGHVGALRIFAFAIAGIPENYTTMEAHRLDDSLPISAKNIGWFHKGEGAKRTLLGTKKAVQPNIKESKDTFQGVIEGEAWQNLRYCVYSAGTQRIMAPDYTDTQIPCTMIEYDNNKQVSNFGRVRFRSKHSQIDKDYTYTKGTLLAQSGYRTLSLCCDGVSRHGMVHVAVMHTFCGPQHENDLHISYTVDHENHNRGDNRLSNLSYRSRREQRVNQSVYLSAHNLPSFDALSADQQAYLKHVGRPTMAGGVIGDIEPFWRQHIEVLKARAQLLILDRVVPTLHRFLNGESLFDVKSFTTDAHLIEVTESLFIYSSDELQPIFERSDWIYKPCSSTNWKDTSNRNMLVSRDRINGALSVLHKNGEPDIDSINIDWKNDIVKKVQLKMFFNQMYSWHWSHTYPNDPDYASI